MSEKYDLEEMMAEIMEDEEVDHSPSSTKVSQDMIQKIIQEKSQKSKGVEKQR